MTAAVFNDTPMSAAAVRNLLMLGLEHIGVVGATNSSVISVLFRGHWTARSCSSGDGDGGRFTSIGGGVEVCGRDSVGMVS